MHTPIIKGELIGGEKTIKAYTSFSDNLHAELRATVVKLGFDLEALVKRKLSGPVLKVGARADDRHKGELRDSINTKIEETATSIIAVVGTSTGRVPYARIHEYGGTITPKTAPYLVFKTADGAWHKVKSVTMPQRSYLRSSLAEMSGGFIEQQLRAALKRAARKSGIDV